MSIPSLKELKKRYGKYCDDNDSEKLSGWTEENHDDKINEEEYLKRALKNSKIFEKKFRQAIDSIDEKTGE